MGEEACRQAQCSVEATAAGKWRLHHPAEWEKPLWLSLEGLDHQGHKDETKHTQRPVHRSVEVHTFGKNAVFGVAELGYGMQTWK